MRRGWRSRYVVSRVRPSWAQLFEARARLGRIPVLRFQDTPRTDRGAPASFDGSKSICYKLFSVLSNLKKRITIMRHLITLSLGLFLVQGLSAEPELKGSPAELAAYLASVHRPVVIVADGEANAQADKATITLRVVTE